jgi:hypothetical protein
MWHACGDENVYRLLAATHEVKLRLEDLGADGRVILKWMVEELAGGLGRGLM